jgi:hypothetical protein
MSATGPTQRHELVAIGDNGFGDYVRQNETEIQEDLDIARDANATSGIRKVNVSAKEENKYSQLGLNTWFITPISVEIYSCFQ